MGWGIQGTKGFQSHEKRFQKTFQELTTMKIKLVFYEKAFLKQFSV